MEFGPIFQVGKESYKLSTLPALTQFHMLRKMSPVIAKSAPIMSMIEALLRNEDPRVILERLDLAAPAFEALAAMPKDDCDAIIFTCLAHVYRVVGNGQVAMANGGMLQYSDLDLPEMMKLVWKGLEANFLIFLPGSRSN